MPRITKSVLCLMLCLAAQVACGRPTPQRAERHASEPVASVQVALAYSWLRTSTEAPSCAARGAAGRGKQAQAPSSPVPIVAWCPS